MPFKDIFFGLIIVALLVVAIRFVIDGIRKKKYKMAVIAVIIFLGISGLLYLGLLGFIASALTSPT